MIDAESIRIHSDFHIEDKGVTRRLVCVMEESHPHFEYNRALIEKAPEMKRLLEKISDTESDIHYREYVEYISSIKRLLQELNDYTYHTLKN